MKQKNRVPPAVIVSASQATRQADCLRATKSLGSLADALYRPRQAAQIQQYIEQGGYSYYGGNMLGLVQHMLRHRVTPAHGSTAQIALAEVARPITRVLEQEIALHYERIDSLAANEGHRPYAAEFRRFGNVCCLRFRHTGIGPRHRTISIRLTK
jgi:hypothetical protein